jgi:septal ring factor EnvC (AmiA/AmiB activator)
VHLRSPSWLSSCDDGPNNSTIAKLEVTHCEDDLANQKTKDEISTLEGKIEADEKDRHEKDDRLDHMLDAIERRRAGPR